MNYKIESLDDLRIVGIGTKEPKTIEECFEQIPLFWQKLNADGTTAKLLSLLDSTGPAAILGVSLCENNAFCGYYVAVITQNPCPPEMEEIIIPAGTWAKFTCIGAMPGAMQKLQQRIVSEWLPTSGYEYASAPDIEVYYEGDQFADNYHCEVWLPVIKSKKA
jgi:AraC family transcriptional regulator